ncbi:hypothetical protein D3C78_1599690 [compost metagenome]
MSSIVEPVGRGRLSVCLERREQPGCLLASAPVGLRIQGRQVQPFVAVDIHRSAAVVVVELAGVEAAVVVGAQRGAGEVLVQ